MKLSGSCSSTESCSYIRSNISAGICPLGSFEVLCRGSWDIVFFPFLSLLCADRNIDLDVMLAVSIVERPGLTCEVDALPCPGAVI